MVPMPLRIKIKNEECARSRILAGYSGLAAARALGVTATHLGNVEAGRGGASPSLLKRMAELYGVPMTSLFDEVIESESVAS